MQKKEKYIMKKFFTSLLYLTTLFIFVGCEKATPTVDFYYTDHGEGYYTFYNDTYWSDYEIHGYDVYWNINGWHVSYYNSFDYQFTTSGYYDVELELYDYDTEKYYTKVKTIYVNLSSSGGTGGGGTGGGDDTSYPTASFTYDYYDNFEIDFYNNSLDATSYSWSFGDGKSSTEREPYHRYSQPGTYTVTLTARNSKGSHQATAKITITKPAYTYFLGIEYTRVPQLNHNYKFVLTDDDVFTTTWGDSQWRTIYSTPYQYIYQTPHLLDGLIDDDYYDLDVYMDTENSSGNIAGWRITTTELTQNYATEIWGNTDDGLTKVKIYFSYEREPLSGSPARNEIKKAKNPIIKEMTLITK